MKSGSLIGIDCQGSLYFRNHDFYANQLSSVTSPSRGEHPIGTI